MKRLIFCAVHGLGGAGGEGSFSPYYPWSAENDLQDFISGHAIIDPRLFSTIFRGLFWKGVLEAGRTAYLSGRYDDVRVVCTKADPVSQHGKWFAAKVIQSFINEGDEVTLIPVGKSLGGFQVLSLVEYLTGRHGTKKRYRQRTGVLRVPAALLIDPDNMFTRNAHRACAVPSVIGDTVVVRQNNRNWKNSLHPRGLCGREMARKNGSLLGITDYLFPEPPMTFPESDSEFAGREVNHWTIDEYMVLYGHPQAGTIESILKQVTENA